jgi:hypothetical protein
MKHPVELYPDFSSLSDCLRNIEDMADELGIEVDDLLKVRQPETQISKSRKILYMKQLSSKTKRGKQFQ